MWTSASGLLHLNSGRWSVEGEVNTIKETVEIRGNFNITNLLYTIKSLDVACYGSESFLIYH